METMHIALREDVNRYKKRSRKSIENYVDAAIQGFKEHIKRAK